MLKKKERKSCIQIGDSNISLKTKADWIKSYSIHSDIDIQCVCVSVQTSQYSVADLLTPVLVSIPGEYWSRLQNQWPVLQGLQENDQLTL